MKYYSPCMKRMKSLIHFQIHYATFNLSLKTSYTLVDSKNQDKVNGSAVTIQLAPRIYSHDHWPERLWVRIQVIAHYTFSDFTINMCILITFYYVSWRTLYDLFLSLNGLRVSRSAANWVETYKLSGNREIGVAKLRKRTEIITIFTLMCIFYWLSTVDI